MALLFVQCWQASNCFGQLAANAGPNQEICQTDQAQIGATPAATGGTPPFTYSWTPSTGLSCITCANPIATPTITTTYTLTVTDADDNSAQDAVTVVINPNPVLVDAFGGSDFIQCTGGNFLLTVFDGSEPSDNSDYRITWGDGSPDFVSSSFPAAGLQHTYAPGQSYTLAYQITGSNTCTSTVEYEVTNITNPGIGVEIPENTVGCGPKDICFSITGFENNDPSTVYEISFGDGADTMFFHPPPTQICHLYTRESCTQAGNSFVFTIQAINNCDVSTAQVSPIKIFTNPQATFSVVPGCLNEVNTFTNTTLEGFDSNCQNNTRYDWDFGDGTFLSTFDKSIQSHTYTISGNYIVRLTAENLCGASVFIDTMRVGAPPVASFDLNTTNGCAPSGEVEVINTSNFQANPGFNTFEWSIAPAVGGTFRSTGTNVSEEQNGIIDFSSPGAYTITLKYTNDCNESLSSQLIEIGEQLTISPANILNLSAVECAPYLFDVTTDLTGPSVSGYHWQIIGSSVPSQPDPSNAQTPGQVALPPGDYSVELTVSNDCGSSNTTSKDFTVIEPGVVNAGEDLVACESEQIVILSGDPPGGIWSGLCITADGSFDPTCAGVNNLGHQLVYTVGSGSCESSDSLIIMVTQGPSTSAGTPKSFCTSSAPFDLALNQNASPEGGTWRINGIVNNIFDPVQLGIGNHEVEYRFSEPGEDCEGVDIITFTVTGSTAIDAGEARSFCVNATPFDLDNQQNASPPGGLWTINGNATNIFDPSLLGAGTHEVQYTFADSTAGCESSEKIVFTVQELPVVSAGPSGSLCFDAPPYNLALEQNASPSGGRWLINGIENDIVVPADLGLGIQEIVYVYADPNTLCEGVDMITLTILELPQITAGNDLELCLDQEPFDLNSKSDISMLGGEWSGPGVTNGFFDPHITDIGDYEIMYTYSDPNSPCTATDIISITVFDTPKVNAGRDVTFCSLTDALILRGHSPKGGTWDGPGVIDPDNGIFSAFQAGAGKHVINYRFTNNFGCSQSDSLVVTVCIDPEEAVQVPTAFTPNGDQLNDTFGPVMDPTTDRYHFQVVTRSNAIVFESDNPIARWDGTFKKTPVQGVFGYNLYVKFTSGLIVEKVGEVLVIR